MPYRCDPTHVYQTACRALRLPRRELLTAARVLLVIILVELSIRWIRLERLARLLGVRVDLRPVQTRHEMLAIESLPPTALRQLRCAWKVAEVWPFSEGPCLRRALVGGHLIRRLDPAIRLGVICDDGTIRAHAWLEIDGRPLDRVDDYVRFEDAHLEATR